MSYTTYSDVVAKWIALSSEFKDKFQRSVTSRAETPVPPAQSPSAKEPATSFYRPRGKIASLPNEQRELINQMLMEGSTYSAVRQKMLEHGVSLNLQNIANWHNGAHQDWLLHLL